MHTCHVSLFRIPPRSVTPPPPLLPHTTQRTLTAMVIGRYPAGMQPGQCNVAVEELGARVGWGGGAGRGGGGGRVGGHAAALPSSFSVSAVRCDVAVRAELVVLFSRLIFVCDAPTP